MPDAIRELDSAWIKQGLVYVPFHDITGWAGAAVGDYLAKGAGDTLKMVSAVAGGGGATKLYDSGHLASAASSIDTGASGIAGGYDMLEFWFYGRTDQTGAFSSTPFTFNNDTGSNYSRQRLEGRNASASVSFSGSRANLDAFVAGSSYDANVFGVVRGSVPFYAETAGYKTVEWSQVVLDTSSSRATAGLWGGVWMSTTAITRMAFTSAVGNLVAGCRLIVFGR